LKGRGNFPFLFVFAKAPITNTLSLGVMHAKKKECKNIKNKYLILIFFDLLLTIKKYEVYF